MPQFGSTGGRLADPSHSVRPVDGRRGYPDERWDDDRGYNEPTWHDGGHRAEPRDPEPSFDGFAAGYGGRDRAAEPQWSDAPAASGPSWNGSAGLLPADPTRRTTEEPRGYPGEALRPVSSEPVAPEPLPAPAAVPPAAPVSGGGPDPADAVNAPTGVMPPVTPRDDAHRFHTEPIDRATLRRPGPTAPVGDGVYRTRRPALALIYGVLTAVFEIGALRVFLDSMFTGPLVVSGVVAGMFLVAGLPLLAVGLYGATTGAGAGPATPNGWLRPPTLYLVAGLALLLAAGFAAG